MRLEEIPQLSKIANGAGEPGKLGRYDEIDAADPDVFEESLELLPVHVLRGFRFVAVDIDQNSPTQLSTILAGDIFLEPLRLKRRIEGNVPFPISLGEMGRPPKKGAQMLPDSY